jgi:hypothetical protein
MPLEKSRKAYGTVINETCCLLAYADDVNLLGESINTIKKNTET